MLRTQRQFRTLLQHTSRIKRFSPTKGHQRIQIKNTEIRCFGASSANAVREEDFESNAFGSDSMYYETEEMRRLMKIRNVGILAHVDAGKTTVTEKFLELSGVVRQAGSVDNGNTVTDYLSAERERGITIQSAAISFEWGWKCPHYEPIENVDINLIDTPGHVDFSVEVNRSVAVLDGAVLVVDAVAGVQAQTETVWRAMTSSTLNHRSIADDEKRSGHEALSSIAFVNKMDKDGSNLEDCIDSIRRKLPGSNPISLQLPLFSDIRTQELGTSDMVDSEFVGVVDLVNMRQIIYGKPGNPPIVSTINDAVDSSIVHAALEARSNIVAALADVDENMEEFFLEEIDPTNDEMQAALRKATVKRDIMPVLVGAALRGKGIEPLLDCIAELLPSPLERLPPNITQDSGSSKSKRKGKRLERLKPVQDSTSCTDVIDVSDRHKSELLLHPPLGHPLNKSLVAFAFKVLHMKGKGSGDGRVVFVRIYSGTIKSKSVVKVSSPSPVSIPTNFRTERISSLLELAGGKFDNLEDGVCQAGGVCALVGLKTVMTGDTIVMSNENTKRSVGNLCLAGVSSPKPVLTVRLEAASSDDENKLNKALDLLVIEDPSLEVKQSDSSATLLSGLGELHIEVVVNRLKSEFGVDVYVGKPTVEYKESVIEEIETDGLLNYDRTIGDSRLQAAVHLRIEPIIQKEENAQILQLVDIDVLVHDNVKEYLNIDLDDSFEDLEVSNEVFSSLINGIRGSLKRGIIGPFPMTNIRVHVLDIESDGGVAYLYDNPGAIRASMANAISSMLSNNSAACVVVEPRMQVEINVPENMVGNVLSDLSNRRGTVGEVVVGDTDNAALDQVKGYVSSTVPLVEMLGYASGLRSLTGGEGNFSAEYKGHSICEFSTLR